MVLAGGVLMVEATKRVHAAPGSGLREAVRRPLNVLDGLGASSPEVKPA
jgi:hypothetical protein